MTHGIAEVELAWTKLREGLKTFDLQTERTTLKAFLGDSIWTIASKVGWTRISSQNQYTTKEVHVDFVKAWRDQQ